jgi:hypothetical protein
VRDQNLAVIDLATGKKRLCRWCAVLKSSPTAPMWSNNATRPPAIPTFWYS